MHIKTIVCLANSRKPPSGRCIAGKEYSGSKLGQWIRPVSSRSSKEISEEERRYENGRRAQIFDIIDIPLKHPEPHYHQTENYRIDEEYYWVRRGRVNWKQIQSLVDQYDQNFWTRGENTLHGHNDKIPESQAHLMQSSLKLIIPNQLKLHVFSEPGFEGRPSRKRVRAKFQYHDLEYELSVTDPEIEEMYLAKSEQYYSIPDALLCISLAEVWNGYAFRLAASIITPDRCEGYNE